MAEPVASNRRIVLARRPDATLQHGDLRLEQVPRPQPGDGELLLQTLWLSLDPYMRGRMNAAASYAEPVAIDAVMVGATVSRVVESRHANYRSEEHTSELQSLMRNSYAVFCLQKKKKQ